MLVDLLGVRITHVATCPEVDPLGCAEADIPDHMHDQRIAWVRLDPTLSVGFGKGWQASVQVPFDVRNVTVDYTTLDGDPYDPPYDDIHHRDETLWGLTDGSAMLRAYTAVGERLVIGGGLGSTLPFGKTEEDPYALTAQGLTHQHLQLGSGVFAPLLGIDALLQGPRWGGLAFGSARLPLYANRKGYQPPATVSAGLGPTFRVTPKIQTFLSVEGGWEGPEHWSGTPYGTRVYATGTLGGLWSASDAVVLQAQARVTPWQISAHTDEDAELAQPLVVLIGASFTFGPEVSTR